MSTLLQEFDFGSPPPKNAIENDDKMTEEDPVNHPASEILKAKGELAPSERIIIQECVFVKDTARAA